jgi:hypothetical protein
MDNQASTMALRFPNPTRYYDATRRAVRFWGHDSAMEATFFVTGHGGGNTFIAAVVGALNRFAAT